MGREKATSQQMTKPVSSRVIIPAIDEFVMQVMGMSQAAYGDGWIVGKSTYERLRPEGWPKLCTVLGHYGYAKDGAGWKQFVDDHIGKPVTDIKERHRQIKRGWCSNCGSTDVMTTGMCPQCRRYWLKYGKKRPRHLWDTDAVCRNCKVPLHALGRFNNGSRRQARGLCTPCNEYKQRTGQPRPKHLWGDGPHGWCECGYPAVALVEDIPVCARHRE